MTTLPINPRILAAFSKSAEAPSTIADLAVLGTAIVNELKAALAPAHDQDRYVTKQELKRIFGVGREKLDNAIAATGLPGIRMGNRTRYSLHTAKALLSEHFAA